MTTLETLWSLGMLGTLTLALWVFRRLRRKTRSFAQGRKFKARLPKWVRTVERLVWVSILMLAGAVLSLGVWSAHAIVMRGQEIEGASAVFSVMGVGLIVLPLSALGANFVSWLLPPVREANLRAMEGLHVSFGNLNRGLILFACVSVPIGLLGISAAVFEPWAR